MALRRTSSTARALYHVFVLPNLHVCQCSATATQHATTKAYPSTKTLRRTLSSSAILSAKETRRPEVRKEKWNEEITAKLIYLIDPETDTLIPEPRTRYDILRRLDQSTHRLVQFETEHEGLPVCKIVSKKEEYQRAKRLKEASKERRKSQGSVQSLKTLELNWAMDPNDLGHRLDKVVEFLGEGRRVEIVLASKKKGRKASPEECEDVLKRIRKAVDGVNGAREAKEMEGKVGGFATLLFQGRQGQPQGIQSAG